MCMVSKNQAVNGEGMRQYIAAGVATATTVAAIYQYAAVRYGVTGLASFNKSLATSTLFLLGLVLLLGPLARQFSIFDRFLKYRKELGVLTFFTALVHVYLSMFALARRGPWGLYLSQPLSAYSGLFALLIMFVLLIVSNSLAERLLGMKFWWKIQNWGARAAFIFIAFHMTALKYSGWGVWLATRDPSLPPLAMLGAVFAVFVLIVRFCEFFVPQRARFVTQLSFFLSLGITLWLFV